MAVNAPETGYEIETEIKPNEIRTAFGKRLDVSEIAGISIDELLAVHRDTLKVEGGDPNFEYGWMDLRDPACQVKLRKGFWQLVTPELDPQIVAPGAINTSEKTFRVNELALVRMPKETYKKMRGAESAIAIRHEVAVKAQFENQIRGLSSKIGGTGEPTFEITEETRTPRK